MNLHAVIPFGEALNLNSCHCCERVSKGVNEQQAVELLLAKYIFTEKTIKHFSDHHNLMYMDLKTSSLCFFTWLFLSIFLALLTYN